MSKVIFLLPAALATSKEAAEFKTILGSCVAVFLYSQHKKVFGMCHYLLPEGNDPEQPYRYGQLALPELLRQITSYGANKSDLKAIVYGGGNVLGNVDLGAAVGRLNIEFAHKFLSDHKIPILLEDTGGTNSRRVSISTESLNEMEKAVRKRHA